MTQAPWTIIGWIIVAFLVLQAVLAPFVFVWFIRQQRRVRERMDALDAEADAMMRDIRAPLPRRRFSLRSTN